MRPPRVRFTVLRLMIAVVVLAALLWSDRMSGRREHCLVLAEWHARGASEFRRNAGGKVMMLEIAAWHDRMRQRLEFAANVPCMPVPASRPFPPWKSPPPNPPTLMPPGSWPPRGSAASP